MKQSNLKKALNAAFTPPPPQRKEAFLNRFPSPRISCLAFVWMQLRYLRGTVAALSLLCLGAGLLGSLFFRPEQLWVLSASSPVLALTVLTALCRSRVWGMEELEQATRFSLKSVLLARMGSLALLHSSLLSLELLFLNRAGVGLLKAGLYLLLPYCTTISVALPLTRKFHGAQMSGCCLGVAVAASCSVWLLRRLAALGTPAVLMPVLALEIWGILRESSKLFTDMEEPVWSYS